MRMSCALLLSSHSIIRNSGRKRSMVDLLRLLITRALFPASPHFILCTAITVLSLACPPLVSSRLKQFPLNHSAIEHEDTKNVENCSVNPMPPHPRWWAFVCLPRPGRVMPGPCSSPHGGHRQPRWAVLTHTGLLVHRQHFLPEGSGNTCK